MKILVWLFIFAMSCRAQYNTLNDSLRFSADDVESLRHHLYCYIDHGPCDDVELSYKQHLAHAHQTLCAECNEEQKQAAYTFHLHAARLFPREYQLYMQIYDPQRSPDAILAAVAPK